VSVLCVLDIWDSSWVFWISWSLLVSVLSSPSHVLIFFSTRAHLLLLFLFSNIYLYLCLCPSVCLSVSHVSTVQQCKYTLNGHTEIVHAVVMDGSRIYSGSSDKSIKVWSNETKKCVKTLQDHTNIVCKLLLTNGHLFSGSYMEIKVGSVCVLRPRGPLHQLEMYHCAMLLCRIRPLHSMYISLFIWAGVRVCLTAFVCVCVCVNGSLACVRK
jgi:WD40 repeat protein